MNNTPLLPYPIYNIFFNINNGCNLRCNYCWYNKTNQVQNFEEMTQDYFLQALNLVKNSIISWKKNNHIFMYPQIKVAIATKEPLLSFYSLIKPVLDTFEFHPYFDIYLLTNGTLLTQEIIDWCIEKNIVIQVSIDGCAESHNTNRMAHEQILKNLAMIPNQKRNLFIVSTLDKNTIPYTKKNLEFFRDFFPNTLIKFNFNIFNNWTNEDWDCVLKQYQDFIIENDTTKIKFLDIYKELPLFLDEGRGFIVGIDRQGYLTIKKPFHSSIPRLKENEILSSFNFGNIYNINYQDWIRFYQTFGRDYSFTRFVNINNHCDSCIEKKSCFNCDYEDRKTKYYLNDDECGLKIFKTKITNMLREKEQNNDY